jgi:WD40 repeat protein
LASPPRALGLRLQPRRRPDRLCEPDNTLRLFAAEGDDELATPAGHTEQVSSCAFNPDGARIVSASFDKTLKLWNAESGAEMQTVSGHAGEIYDCAMSPDGGRIASVGADGVKVWSAD